LTFPLTDTRCAHRALFIILVALAAPAGALGESKSRGPAGNELGKLAQLHGPSGCLVDRSKPVGGCTPVRALKGPAPILGSEAVAISPDAKNVYVASSKSNAIAVFKRNQSDGTLSQRSGTAGCIAAAGAGGCAPAVGLIHPNSVAVSPDGQNVYATAVGSNAITAFSRNSSTGALTQAGDGSGCVSNAALTGCTTGRALDGADVVTVSPDGKNVYVGAFVGNAVAVFARDASTGALTQPAGDSGCLTNAPTGGCTTAIGIGSPEGMAVSADGNNVYVAAAVSDDVAVLDRDPSTGALTQAGDGSGCISNAALTGCTTGTQLSGADAVAVSPDDADVYVTSLFSNSLTSFTRTAGTGDLAQQSGTSACAIYVFAVGCSLARAMSGTEGLAVSADGANVYTAADESNAIVVFNRNTSTGAVIQKSGRMGCVTTSKAPDCRRARALSQVGSLAVSPDGKNVYSAAFASNAVAVFKRVSRSR
jgi:DNA-binding beta-propeller fold protein YncE